MREQIEIPRSWPCGADVRDKRVVLTGAGRGLGRLLAHAFSQAGARVALVSRTETELKELAAELPGPSLVCTGDVTDEADNEAVADATAAEWGGVDVWICNAGISPIVAEGPLVIITMRSESSTASSTSWVIMMTALRKRPWISISESCRCARVITSGESVKAHNAGRPGAVAAICQVDGARWLTISGPVRVDTDPAAIAEAVSRYAARYRQPRVNPLRVALIIEVDRMLGSSRLG